MFFFSLSGLVNGLSATCLGIFVLLQPQRDARHKIYALFCLSVCIWSYGYFFWLRASDDHAALLWARVLMVGAMMIPPTAFHHLVKMMRRRPPAGFILGNYIVSGLLLAGNLGPWVVQSVGPKLSFPYWPVPGPLFHVHFLQVAGLALLGLGILRKEFLKSQGILRNQVKYLMIAEVIGYAGGLTNYPLWYDIPIPPWGNIGLSFYSAIFAYAMVRYRLLDIEIVIKRGLIYVLLLLILMIPCYIVILWAQVSIFGKVSPQFSVIALFLFILVGFLFPKIRFRTEEAFERVLFKKEYDYRETLLRFSSDVISVVDLEGLANMLVRTVSRALGTERISLFLLDEGRGAFRLTAATGRDGRADPMGSLDRNDPLIRMLIHAREPLVREELDMVGDEEGKMAAGKMRGMEAEVTLPLMLKGRPVGLLNLGHKEDREMYSTEDLKVLSTLANQTAIAIENARLYEDLKQSQTIIRRSDRLSSLGMLTAGLAHEIRNPLVAIRTFTQLLPERYQDPEFRDSFRSLALKEVDRICGLVNDLLSFARPSAPNIAAENVDEIVEGIARLLQSQAKEKGVEIRCSFAGGLPKISIDKEQIKQVMMNIILNAIQAIEDGGVVDVVTRRFVKEKSHFVQIEVRDSGVGIPEKDLENIFNPFFTTKDDGVGLGLAISNQIIQEHGGYLALESRVGQGTAFFINLPFGEENRGPESQ